MASSIYSLAEYTLELLSEYHMTALLQCTGNPDSLFSVQTETLMHACSKRNTLIDK